MGEHKEGNAGGRVGQGGMTLFNRCVGPFASTCLEKEI